MKPKPSPVQKAPSGPSPLKSLGEKFILDLTQKKAQKQAVDFLNKAISAGWGVPGQPGPTQDEDGMFTELGMEIVSQYAKEWLKGTRVFALEQKYPDLTGAFYDVRTDEDIAIRYGSDD